MDDLTVKTPIRKFDESSIIFEEGAIGSEFYIILSGAVAIQRNFNGELREIALLRPGEFFGEMAVLDHQPRSATAVAVEPGTELMAVDTARFIYLVSQQPGFAMLVMEALSNRLRGTATERPTSLTPISQKLSDIIPIDETCFQLCSHTRSANAYLFRGSKLNLLVDTGLPSSAETLCKALRELGVTPSDMSVIVLTHEHFDHTGAVPFFGGKQTVAAHMLAANKINLRDEFATLQRGFGEPFTPFSVDWELTDGTIIDTGCHRLRVFHTPGHSSGSISLIDLHNGLLVSGDTVLKGGPIGGIFGSGNISDMIYSLKLLHSLSPKLLMPGHGPLSSQATNDINLTLDRCHSLLNDSKVLFDALQENESVNLIINSYKDLNRSFMRYSDRGFP
jgi:glyoxylase-like metal-dependent hydrolase (beta-lactamase superfamily II)